MNQDETKSSLHKLSALSSSLMPAAHRPSINLKNYKVMSEKILLESYS